MAERPALLPASRSLDRAHSGVDMLIKWERELKKNTSRTATKYRLTHRIDIASIDEIDDALKHALARAYKRDE